MGYSPKQDPPLVGKSGVGVERFIDFHLCVENLLRYHVPLHHTPIWVPHTHNGHKKMHESLAGIQQKVNNT
jgi:hypothetical protein